jgi:hypothetical protein
VDQSDRIGPLTSCELAFTLIHMTHDQAAALMISNEMVLSRDGRIADRRAKPIWVSYGWDDCPLRGPTWIRPVSRAQTIRSPRNDGTGGLMPRRL